MNTASDFVRIRKMMQRTRDMKLRVIANRRVMLDLLNSGIKFTRIELQHLATAFVHESDISGHLDVHALRHLLALYLPNVAAAEPELLDRVFMAIDANRDQRLSFREFAVGLSNISYVAMVCL